MLEKRFPVVLPQNFTANGSSNGVITVVDTRLFKVKQLVKISGTALPTLDKLEVKNILSFTQLIVGPAGGSIHTTVDVSAYTVALSSAIFYPETQKRPTITADDFERAVYDEEPVVAKRVVLVDEMGNKYNAKNPLPVNDAGETTREVRITAADNDPTPGFVHSSVRVSNGATDLAINPDGSINVNVVTSFVSLTNVVLNNYGEANSVVSGATTQIASYTVPIDKISIIQKIEVSGENIAKYQVLVNGVAIGTMRTYFGGALNATVDYLTGQDNGLVLLVGDTVSVNVLHNRPNLANFEARIQVLQIIKVNPDQSVNLVTKPSTNVDPAGTVVLNNYGEASSVIAGATTQITSYTVPAHKVAIIQKIEVSGENIAKYQVLVNGAAIGTMRTYFGGALNTTADFLTGQDNGLIVLAGDVVSVSVLHHRPDLANFEARIQVLQVT